MRIGFGALFPETATVFGAHAALGVPNGAYGSAALMAVDYKGPGENGTQYSFEGGYQLFSRPNGNAQLCPTVGFMAENTAGVATRMVSFGGTLGGVAGKSGKLEIVPFVSGVGSVLRTSIDYYGYITQRVFNLTVGAGFVVDHVLTVRPGFVIPVGDNLVSPYFAFSVGLNIALP